MTIREQLAIAICGAPHHAFPPLPLSIDRDEMRRRMSEPDPPLVVMESRCVCARDGRTPKETVVRCADCLAQADRVIEFLAQQMHLHLED